jgi:hypothetical protein
MNILLKKVEIAMKIKSIKNFTLCISVSMHKWSKFDLKNVYIRVINLYSCVWRISDLHRQKKMKIFTLSKLFIDFISFQYIKLNIWCFSPYFFLNHFCKRNIIVMMDIGYISITTFQHQRWIIIMNEWWLLIWLFTAKKLIAFSTSLLFFNLSKL